MKQTGALVVSLRGVNFKFWILVSLRVFQAQQQYIKLPRSTELREEKQKSCFLFNLFCFRSRVFLSGLFYGLKSA